MIATNLLQLSSSAKALFGAELDFKNYYRKFSPVVWQLPRIPESLEDQYNKIFQAFCNAYKLGDDIKDLLWKVYSKKSCCHFPTSSSNAKKVDFIFQKHFLLTIKPSLREIKSVFHIFFDVIKNLKITQSKFDERLFYLKNPYVILEKMFIDESLLLHMLVSILLKICKNLEKEKIDKQQNNDGYLHIFGGSTGSGYVNGIVNSAVECIKKYCLVENLPDIRIIVFYKDGFINGMSCSNSSNPSIYYHLYPFNDTDNKIYPVNNFEPISEKIESLISSGFDGEIVNLKNW